MVANFPNLFMVTGPGSPSVLTNMLPSIEQHVEWIADCLAFLRQHGVGAIEPTDAAEDAWVGSDSIFHRCRQFQVSIPSRGGRE